MRRLIRIIPIVLLAALLSPACGLQHIMMSGPTKPVPPKSETGTQVPPVEVPIAPIAILTVKVLGPAVAFVKVGDREWPTRPDRTIVEEFPAGTVATITVRADGFISREFKDMTLVAGPSVLRVDLARVPAPVSTAKVAWPALCASYYASPTDPDLDLDLFAKWLQEHGATCTRAWLMDAWAIGERDASGKFLPGQYDGFLPVTKLADGRYDLYQWNAKYFERLRRYTEVLNAHGVWPHLTVLELYSWSDRKASLPFVPDVNKNPMRNNVNGVRWGAPDDRTFGADPENNPDQLPDAWMRAFIAKVVDTLKGTVWAAEIGNEMPEKGMHFRIHGALRAAGFAGEITVNRNEDTPGQYWNMQVGQVFDRLALHNFLSPEYLDEEHPREAGAGRPITFRRMWAQVDPARIIVSSDGGGGNPNHLPKLKEVACDAFRRGGSYEHQLALKRRRFFGDGSLQMADLTIDSEFLKSLAACRR